MWWKNRFNGLYGMPMDKAGGDGGGGGTGGSGGSGGAGGDGNKGSPDPRDAQIAELNAKIAALEGKGGGSNGGDHDLAQKTQKDREAREKAAADQKSLEGAITFNLQREDFFKKNSALLPESVKDLFATADKETYDSPVQKSSEIKSGLIQEFFAIQANHDLLTPAQKSGLADFLKLTKDGKRERAQSVYENIFEPALEMLRTVKKAEEVQRARNGYGDDSDAGYKQKLISHSRGHYLGEKK